ncbi:MBL fold metallo-hydrolase [Streptomyces sp. 8L]|uniref:MBL fold metallo-hydrolase n=1 Tax=Streptomyces sp. 8L TaxID=2877242 RepID=UPI001CD6F8F5|nr:MBL fold metallo-hydrolase [Streptomyces sp. 8L]MCA1216940.1 MBL fold metallo-hydrolase [Streptomyces sp. 8L]
MRSTEHSAPPGFTRTGVGSSTVTTLYDGALPIFSSDMHGESPKRITELLADGFLPPEGDLLTAVNVFLFDAGGRTVLVDAGAGTSLGPGTGHLLTSLRASGTAPEDIDDVLITHMHPDHAFGLLTTGGDAAFPNATVHVARADLDHWLNDTIEAGAEGVQAQIHRWGREALAPYRAGGQVSGFAYGDQPVPQVTAVDLHGHTPGHTGYLLSGADGMNASESVLFWGDTVHSHTVQLRAPRVAMEIDSDRPTARTSRARILDELRARRWAVAGAHLPFPGIGHLRFHDDEATWIPIPYRPLEAA